MIYQITKKNFGHFLDPSAVALEIANKRIVGECFGLYSDDRFIPKDDPSFLDVIRHKSGEETAQRLCGRCFVCIIADKHIDIYLPLSHPGIFYCFDNQRVIFSLSEKLMYEEIGDFSFNDWEMFNLVISHHGLRSPNSSLAHTVLRAIGGTRLTVSSELLITKQFFALEEKRDAAIPNSSYSDIVFQLEQSCRAANHFDFKRKTLFFSGGVDSSALLVALKKANVDFTALNWPLLEAQTRLCCELSSQADVKLEVSKFGDESRYTPKEKHNIMLEMYSQHINLTSFWNSGTLELMAQENSDQIFISGQNFDSLYFIDTYAPAFTAYGTRYLIKLMSSVILRYRNTIAYFRRLIREHGTKTMRCYVESIANSNVEHAVPMAGSNVNLQFYDKTLAENYVAYKQADVAEPFLKELAAKGYLKEPLDASHLNYIAKVLKFSRFVCNTSLNYYGYECFAGIKRILPALEGSLPSTLMKTRLGWRDIFVIKRHLYRYYREFFGTFHYFDRKRATQSCEPNNLFKNVQNLKRMILRTASPQAEKTQEEIAIFQDFYRSYFGSTSPILVALAQDNDIKSYYRKLHELAMGEDFENLEKSNVMEFERFLNLNIFIDRLRNPAMRRIAN